MLPINSVNAVLSVRASPETAPQELSPNAKRPPQPRQVEESKSDAPASQASISSVMREVTLRYKIDPDTQSLSLLIIDRQSRKIIRTVPPEELARLGIDRIFEEFA